MWTPTLLIFLISGVFCNELSNSIVELLPSLYEEIGKKNQENLIFSPFSSDVVLLWLLTGARGETANELQTTLKLPSVDETTVKILKSVSSYTQTANKLYLKPGFEVKEAFRTTSVNTFLADIETVEFSDRQAAAAIINNWVANHTNNKIENLVDSKNLDSDTRAVLVNALYLQANWKQVFFPAHPEEFYKSETDVVSVPTIRSGVHFYKYFECSKARHVQIPFEKEGVLTIVLPKEKFGLAELEEHLPSVFSSNNNFTMKLVNIALPKFNIETEIDFKKVLESLHVTKIFSSATADLSGIAGVKGDLFVDNIIQKSFIRVNEKGIEAGAATYATVANRVAVFRDAEEEILVNHPFLWYIKSNDVILFAGRVKAPLSKK